MSKAEDAKILKWNRLRYGPVLERARRAHKSGGKHSNIAPYDAVAICLGLVEDGAKEVCVPLWAAEALVREGERLAFEGPTKGQANRLRDAQIVHHLRLGMDRKAVALKMKVSVKAVDRARRNGFGYYSLLVHRQSTPAWLRKFATSPEDFAGASLLGWGLDGREGGSKPRAPKRRPASGPSRRP